MRKKKNIFQRKKREREREREEAVVFFEFSMLAFANVD